MHQWHPITPLLAAVVLVGGCGDEGRQGTARQTDGAGLPAPVARSSADGTVVLHGDYGPRRHGPLRLDGRYRVSFTQRGEGVDFGTEVPFTAHIEQGGASGAPRTTKLFERAARTGATTVEVRGSTVVVVDFGDSPYVLTLRRTR